MDETSGSTHDLLLALAGRLDDDLLAWARELVAVGEDTRAVELVTAGLTADGTPLPASLRAAVVEAATAARIDLDADASLPAAAGSTDHTEHRFTAAAADERVADAVHALPVRLLDGARVRLAWRLTPAGTAPGPLPHPVLLVQVEPDGRPADVLAYQLSVALDRAGVVASVEVLTSGRPVSAYHAAALGDARPVAAASPVIDRPQPAGADEPAERRGHRVDDIPEPVPFRARNGQAPEPADEETATTDPTPRPGPAFLEEPTAPRPLRAADGGGGRRRRLTPDPGPSPAPRPDEQRRPTVTPISRTALPSPVPLIRRDGNHPRPLVPVDQATDQQRAVRAAAERGTAAADEGQVPALADTPTFRSRQDPLSGPLHTPLLAPLLDPTPPAAPADDTYDDTYGDERYDGPFGSHGISPLAPDAPAPVEDRWATEWASGDWAVSPSDLETPRPGDGEEQPDEPAAAPSGPGDARHRFSGPPPAEPPPPVQERVPAAAPAPGPDLGLRADSLARLSDADRELLARLQSELGAGRKPRATRRAGVAPDGSNGNGPGPNGRTTPPNLAG